MVPIQMNNSFTSHYPSNTGQLHYTDINLHINRDEENSAEGYIYMDGGDSMSEITEGSATYEYYKFEMADNTI